MPIGPLWTVRNQKKNPHDPCKSLWTVDLRTARGPREKWSAHARLGPCVHPRIHTLGSVLMIGLGAAVLDRATAASVGLHRFDFYAIFYRAYFFHPISVWADLRLIGRRSSSRTSLWAQYGSNLETSNPNNSLLRRMMESKTLG